jgi:hypothetical protein
MRMDIVMWDDDIIIEMKFVIEIGMKILKDLKKVV